MFPARDRIKFCLSCGCRILATRNQIRCPGCAATELKKAKARSRKRLRLKRGREK